jgi:hypothetical protein
VSYAQSSRTDGRPATNYDGLCLACDSPAALGSWGRVASFCSAGCKVRHRQATQGVIRRRRPESPSSWSIAARAMGIGACWVAISRRARCGNVLGR